jgi:hypothetical protein
VIPQRFLFRARDPHLGNGAAASISAKTRASRRSLLIRSQGARSSLEDAATTQLMLAAPR